MGLFIYLAIMIDVIVVTLSDYFKQKQIILLYLYFIQDLTIWFAWLFIMCQFFHEDNIRLVGKFGLLLKKHWSILVILPYFVMTILIQFINCLQFNFEQQQQQQPSYSIAFLLAQIVQRLLAIVYYFLLNQNITFSLNDKKPISSIIDDNGHNYVDIITNNK